MTDFTPEQQAKVNEIVQERLARDRQTRVTHEPRVYDLHSPHSWYLDVVASRTDKHPLAAAAKERQRRYARELGSEMTHGTKEGRRCERILRAIERIPNPDEHERRFLERVSELRGFGTDGGTSATSGGEAASFVSPAFLLEQWAPFRGPVKSFTEQCIQLPLPAYGMKIYLPFVSTTDKVGEQTEGGAVGETAPTTELEASPTVATITGQIILSQQFHDRAGTGGGAIDAVIGMQLQQQLDSALDTFVLNHVIEQGTAIKGQASYSTKGLYEDIAKAREKIADTAGTRLRPTHIFSTSDLYAYATNQVDKNERPILVPSYATGFPLSGDADDHDEDNKIKPWSRFTGTIMPGNLLWLTDDNIPAVGTTENTQILVSSPGDAIVVLQDEPIMTPFVETKANTLQVVLNLRSYVGTITRHAAGTSVITGAAYVTSEK
jgi:hypothetical protein